MKAALANDSLSLRLAIGKGKHAKTRSHRERTPSVVSGSKTLKVSVKATKK